MPTERIPSRETLEDIVNRYDFSVKDKNTMRRVSDYFDQFERRNKLLISMTIREYKLFERCRWFISFRHLLWRRIKIKKAALMVQLRKNLKTIR